MSIRLRLNLAIALVVAGALAAIIATTLLKAAPRIRAENESIMRLSKEFVETAVESLPGMKNPAQGLEGLLNGLKDLRHVEITLKQIMSSPAGGSAASDSPQRADAGVPRWFMRLVSPPRISESIPVAVDGRQLGQLVISTKSSDEIKEIWDATIELVLYGAAVGAMTIALASLIVSRAVAPVAHLHDALAQLKGGDYEVRVPELGPPEIAAIGSKINALAEALMHERLRNRQLTERIIDIQDAERKELAYELHDELGPHLFAIRAAATAMAGEVAKPQPDRARLASGNRMLLEQIETIQQSNRRVLDRLRPMALAEFGLVAAIERLIAGWREARPDVAITSRLDIPEGCGETVELTIYRFVQEGLTNAFRHAGARRIDVEVAGASTALTARIRDDGAGMPDRLKIGFGLTGMQERISAIGGRFSIRSRAEGGTELSAIIPKSQSGSQV